MNTFQDLHSGDRVAFWYRSGMKKPVKMIRKVLPMLVFENHVQVDIKPFGYTVDKSNFIRKL